MTNKFQIVVILKDSTRFIAPKLFDTRRQARKWCEKYKDARAFNLIKPNGQEEHLYWSSPMYGSKSC